MTYQISKLFSFSASHQLTGLREGHPCMRLHGHNYEVEVVLSSEVLDMHGFVLDYGDLNPLKVYIDANLDHKHLNEVYPDINPTAENLAKILFDACYENWGDVVKEVRVSETPKTWASYAMWQAVL